MIWWWRWLRARRHRNGDAARRAIQQAQESLTQAQRQTRRTDWTTERAQDLADRSTWFARDMERALHLRRGSS